jgi:hypothetical protein
MPSPWRLVMTMATKKRRWWGLDVAAGVEGSNADAACVVVLAVPAMVLT